MLVHSCKIAHLDTILLQVKVKHDGADDHAAALACLKAMYLQKLPVDEEPSTSDASLKPVLLLVKVFDLLIG